MVLVRHHLGGVLRRIRTRRGRTLRRVAADAQMSMGYLSEIERGQKEASSELLAAICGALQVSVAEVLRDVSDELVLVETIPANPANAANPADAVNAADSSNPVEAAEPSRIAERRRQRTAQPSGAPQKVGALSADGPRNQVAA